MAMRVRNHSLLSPEVSLGTSFGLAPDISVLTSLSFCCVGTERKLMLIVTVVYLSFLFNSYTPSTDITPRIIKFYNDASI